MIIAGDTLKQRLNQNTSGSTNWYNSLVFEFRYVFKAAIVNFTISVMLQEKWKWLWSLCEGKGKGKSKVFPAHFLKVYEGVRYSTTDLYLSSSQRWARSQLHIIWEWSKAGKKGCVIGLVCFCTLNCSDYIWLSTYQTTLTVSTSSPCFTH